MKIGILSNEYPPNVYGGAGVHVEYLTRELLRAENNAHSVNVMCFGDQDIDETKLTVKGVDSQTDIPVKDPKHAKFMDTMLKGLLMGGSFSDIDVVHCHTWYSHFAGLLVKQLQQVPLILTTHSLEPHRPWKVEQLGSAYNASSWVEETAYRNADGVIAVSESMKEDVHNLYDVPYSKIKVIHNGIDLNQYKPTPDVSVLEGYGIDPNKPFLLFVGRITRQKGIVHLVEALKYIDEGVQIVLCAGAPDTEEIAKEMEDKVAAARTEAANPIIWISEMVSKEVVINLYTHATVFICPSVYEPFGIINLEAMACETPVVASAVGGIPEVVVPGETGLLVNIEATSEEDVEPKDPAKFAKDLADAVNSLLADPAKMKEMGLKARKRVEDYFSWESIAIKTIEFYKEIKERSCQK